MNRKVPSLKEGRKTTTTNQITFLQLNKKKPLQIRFLSPLCKPVFSMPGPFSQYCSFVIDRSDNKIKMFEFSGAIFESIRYLIKSQSDYPQHEIDDPGDSVHGGEWEIYWDKANQQWSPRIINMEIISKKDRKLIHQFLSDIPQPFVEYEHYIKEMVEPACERTEDLIKIR